MSTESNDNGSKFPPVESRYKRGQCGNPRGRPKGARSKKLIAKKVALKHLTQTINGRKRTLTALEWVILTLRATQMEGHTGAASLVDDLLAQMEPQETERGVGFLLVPECLTSEEWIAQAERHNAEALYEPGSEEWERHNRG